MPFFCTVPLRLDRYVPKTWSIFKINHVSGQLPRPRQRPWFSFAFFSCIKTRKEGRGMGAKPPIFRPQDQYTRKMNRVSIIHRIWISKTWRVFGLSDRYNLKNWRVSIIHWIWTPKTWRVFWLLDHYNLKNESRFHHSLNMNVQNVTRFRIVRSL